jgi:hypothetical protein
VIGEIGLDMSVSGTHQRLCSWAKTSPRTKQSGRKNGKASTGKGNPYLKAALGQMAVGAAKTDTFLGERYRRLVKRMPKAKALAAIERSILVIIFHMLADPNTQFADLGADFYTRRIDAPAAPANSPANCRLSATPSPSPRRPDPHNARTPPTRRGHIRLPTSPWIFRSATRCTPSPRRKSEWQTFWTPRPGCRLFGCHRDSWSGGSVGADQYRVPRSSPT